MERVLMPETKCTKISWKIQDYLTFGALNSQMKNWAVSTRSSILNKLSRPRIRLATIGTADPLVSELKVQGAEREYLSKWTQTHLSIQKITTTEIVLQELKIPEPAETLSLC